TTSAPYPARPEPPPALERSPESVDAWGYALYKTGQWRRAQSRRRCSLSGAAHREQVWHLLRPWHSLENTGKHISVDHETSVPGQDEPGPPRSVPVEGYL